MSAYEKYQEMEKLVAMGWSVVDGAGPFLVPPVSLWENRPTKFHIFDAMELQSLLQPEED